MGGTGSKRGWDGKGEAERGDAARRGRLKNPRSDCEKAWGSSMGAVWARHTPLMTDWIWCASGRPVHPPRIVTPLHATAFTSVRRPHLHVVAPRVVDDGRIAQHVVCRWLGGAEVRERGAGRRCRKGAEEERRKDES